METKASSGMGVIPGIQESSPYQSKEADTERTGFSGRRQPKRGESISDQLASDFFHYKNFKVDEIRKLHPELPEMWTVFKMYPEAKNGPLYVDEPVRVWEIESCKKKAVLMRKFGLRYIYITPHMQVIEAVAQMDGRKLEEENGLAGHTNGADGTSKTSERQRDRQTSGAENSPRKNRR